MEPEKYEITNGYIGSFGVSYKTATQKEFAETITLAAEYNEIPEEMVISLLENKTPVKWCKSPNYYYDHSFGMIRMKRIPKQIKMVMCSCGHEVEDGLQMSTSMGTSCPDCYDEMEF